MVSSPYRLQSSFAFSRLGKLSFSIITPNAAPVSYSTLWCLSPLYGPSSLTDMWPPQAIVQRQQPYFLSA